MASLGFMSIIGRKTMDDSLDDCHVVQTASSQIMLALVRQHDGCLPYEVQVGRWVLRIHIDNPFVSDCVCSTTYFLMEHNWNSPIMDTSSDDGIGGLGTGVTAAIIPMPWNVLLPSRVRMLWSTLSAAYWMNSPEKPGISVICDTTALCTNLCTSLYEQQNPIW